MFLLWTLLGVIVLFVLLRLLVISYTVRLTKTLIDDRHSDADAILDTGLVPDRWVVKSGRRPRRRMPLTRRRALRRLRTIIRYFSRTPVVADEVQREDIMSRLQSTYATWRSSSLEDLIPDRYR